LVLVGDNPYITAGALQKLIAQHRQSRAKCTLISAVFPGNPPPYGRIIRNEQGEVQGIVEEKDASSAQRQIREVNASIYLFDNRVVFPLLAQIDNHNLKKEYYLTDIIAILQRENLQVQAVQAADCAIAIGINNRQDLQAAHAKFNCQLQQTLLENGVTILQPETVTIEHDVEIGRDTVIYPCTYLAAGTRIGKNCSIGPFVYLKDANINDNEKIVLAKKES
jgi:bifunctional UDP-N-acetylglucosamine pyrophosphorylase/glucosamine-1-phosphate N-acetyltransferase